jgi:hypothetical protein
MYSLRATLGCEKPFGKNTTGPWKGDQQHRRDAFAETLSAMHESFLAY